MSWFSLFTEKQKLKHENALLKQTVDENLLADMAFRLKKHSYNKEIWKNGFQCVISAVITGTIICLLFNYC